MSHLDEFDRLYELDFNSPLSAPLRLVGVAIGGALVCSYFDAYWPITWSVCYTILHLLYYFYLRGGTKRTFKALPRIAYSIHVAVMASFVWMPVYLMATGDHTATLIGAALFASLLVLLVRRADTDIGHVICQAAVLGLSLVILAFDAILKTTDPVGIAGIIIAATVLQFYFIQAWSYTRRVTREHYEETVRAAQTEKMAAIGRLAGGVAHDFNNQLTAISGNLELMQLCNSDEEREEFVKSAMIACEQAASTVKEITSFARKEQASLAAIKASDVMHDLEQIASRLAPASITCSFRDEATRDFLAVKGQMLNGLLNLVSNSIDAMPNGGSIRVMSIDYRSEEPIPLRNRVALPPGYYVEFSVEDNGRGIEHAIIDKVFEDYFTTKQIGEGTGLGLASVAGLIATFGGGVFVESSPRGTLMRLLIPALEE